MVFVHIIKHSDRSISHDDSIFIGCFIGIIYYNIGIPNTHARRFVNFYCMITKNVVFYSVTVRLVDTESPGELDDILDTVLAKFQTFLHNFSRFDLEFAGAVVCIVDEFNAFLFEVMAFNNQP